KDAQDVAQRGTVPRGDDADAARKWRQRTLAGDGEEALRLQPGPELFEGELQGPHPTRLQQFHDELVPPALGVYLEAAKGEHVHAVLRLEAQAPDARPEQRRRQLRTRILQGEVGMAGCVEAKVAD